MSSNEESLKDAKSLHKTSVSDEVVIKFDHVTKTYNLYKTTADASSAFSTTTARVRFWEASMQAKICRLRSRRARLWPFSVVTGRGRVRHSRW